MREKGVMPNRLLRVVVSVAVILGAVTLLFLATVKQDAQYYKHVDEVMASPERWYGKSLQLHGFVDGVPDHTGNGLDYRFKVKNGDAVVNASYHGADMPDTFKEGSEVVLTGRLTSAGFHADSVMAKCPSKYVPSDGKAK
jgi:cytochrome c-type biogenesis protein CcmE